LQKFGRLKKVSYFTIFLFFFKCFSNLFIYLFILEFCHSFVDRVKEALTQYGVNAGTLSEERVSALLQEFSLKIDRQLMGISGTLITGEVAVVKERVEDGSRYQLHLYNGSFHRVPKDWRWPHCGVRDLWCQWWVGDSERHIPPLRFLQTIDVKYIDAEPLTAVEKERKVGPLKDSR
jgi:hypothetical protein